MAQLRFKKDAVQAVVCINNYLYAGSRRHASNRPLSSGSPRNVCNKGTLLHSFCPKAFATYRSLRLRSDTRQTGHWLLRVELQKTGSWFSSVQNADIQRESNQSAQLFTQTLLVAGLGFDGIGIFGCAHSSAFVFKNN